MELHPQVIEKEGRKEFVVLPFEEYQALTELMYDYEDLRDLREAKEESKDQETVSLDRAG
jgi:PHD/YefM family antitoxin component YafN of YafNO toxin-antitoxin module